MRFVDFPAWKEAPFLRLLLPFAAGIAMQYYGCFPKTILLAGVLAPGVLLPVLALARVSARYRFLWMGGVLINMLLIGVGGWVLYQRDVSNQDRWVGRSSAKATAIIAVLDEPLSQRAASFRAIAGVRCVIAGDSGFAATGKIMIYFDKNLTGSSLPVNTVILIRRPLTRIRGSGNPGAFDYSRYCALQGVFHSVYLREGDFQVAGYENRVWKAFLYQAREKVLSILKRDIPGRKEAGLAEALLIGYKEDLDPALVQAYSGTGVMHVIAISGMHLGLIYWLLASSMRPLRNRRFAALVKPLIIIAALWAFSILAGASPSVLRSAFMFTLIIIGEALARKTSIFNSLAASAFLLLCYNPLGLWDAGFQLSYAAVAGILIYQAPIYQKVVVGNRLLDKLWKITAVTLAAQVLTAPLGIYYFNQFPNYFLFTNLIAIPLSSLVLLGELALCALFFQPQCSGFLGQVLGFMIRLMNDVIGHIGKIPGSVTNGLQLSLLQLFVLYALIALVSWGYLRNSNTAKVLALACCAIMVALRTAGVVRAHQQHFLIVYNVKGLAIDWITGRQSLLLADSNLLRDRFFLQSCLAPSQLRHRVTSITNYVVADGIFRLPVATPRVCIRRGSPARSPGGFDLVIISGRASPAAEAAALDCRTIVLDGSVSASAVRRWKAACRKKGVPCWSVRERGAFILRLN